MNPTQAVILTQLLSFTLFWLAGDQARTKTANGLRRLRGQPALPGPTTPSGPTMTVSVASGWAVMFLTLIVFTDIEATAPLAAAFAWLILISIALAYGEDAFNNITKLLGQSPTSLPTPANDHLGGK